MEADLVVGADGLHSGVRGLAFGPERDYRHFLGAYLAVYTLPDVLHAGPTVASFAAPGLAATVYPTATAGLGRALFLIRTPIENLTPAAARDLIGDAFGPRLAPVLEHFGRAGDFYFDEIAQIRMASWSRGRGVRAGGRTGRRP
ncbi:hypothetical protein AB0M54_20715 [Actinoplanes sp. NPDC051470]|uniref:hypothetical protein n=1 Tax=Actinoplanes sp. NPDC051470 TaxID=3157224 RepID=UPI003440D7CC